MKNNEKVSDSASSGKPSQNNEPKKDNNGEQSGSKLNYFILFIKGLEKCKLVCNTNDAESTVL